MARYVRRFFAIFAVCILVVGTTGVGTAQETLPAGIYLTLNAAAERGDDALLRAVQDAVSANPIQT